MLDKLAGIVMLVIFGVFTFFVFDFIRLAYNSDVYSNALLILLGMLVIVMNFLLAILVRSLK
jgi:hypothetical protein